MAAALAGTVAEQVLEAGTAVLVDDAALRDVEGSYLPATLALGTSMLLPLVDSNGVRSVLVAARRRDRRHFTAVDLEMGKTFATHASLALELAEARRVDHDQLRVGPVQEGEESGSVRAEVHGAGRAFDRAQAEHVAVKGFHTVQVAHGQRHAADTQRVHGRGGARFGSSLHGCFPLVAGCDRRCARHPPNGMSAS